MKRSPTRTQRAVTRRLTEVAFAVPQVLAHRAGSLAATRPSAAQRREMSLMVTEKAAAFSEAWIAMSMQAMRINMAWLLRAPLAPVSAGRVHADMLSLFNAGLAPVHRRAVANARRLGKNGVGVDFR